MPSTAVGNPDAGEHHVGAATSPQNIRQHPRSATAGPDGTSDHATLRVAQRHLTGRDAGATNATATPGGSKEVGWPPHAGGHVRFPPPLEIRKLGHIRTCCTAALRDSIYPAPPDSRQDTVELVITAWILYQTTVATPPPQTAAERQPVAERRRTARHRRQRQQKRKRRQSKQQRLPHRHGSHHRLLHRLAHCESNHNPNATSPSGRFIGAWQHHPDTWDAHKPDGYPDSPLQATLQQQRTVAHATLHIQGVDAWPTCSDKLGLR